jgi:uncharacterized protein YcaQ
VTIETLRRFAVARTLSPAATLQQAIDTAGFVQADPIRAPARAQDLTLRHRVAGYRAGDLDRAYPDLAVEETFFINYGFVSERVYRLIHPRSAPGAWSRSKRQRADAILAFVRERGAVHPREVDRHFDHGRVTNYWGGASKATTHLLDAMHYRGLLRVVGRRGGVRIYGLPRNDGPDLLDGPDQRLDALVDVIVALYAPVPGRTLVNLVARLRDAVPQWSRRLERALRRARERFATARVGDAEWYWPGAEKPDEAQVEDRVRLMAPFDPLVWDRLRFERFWGWDYRFEAYTPAPKRRFGYYALPLLWRDVAVGWANVSVANGGVEATVGYAGGRPPRTRGFKAAFDEEIDRLRWFMGSGS